jgi:hypothetical protein
MKGLDETGLLIMSCRHGWVWRALNLFMGETYRHVLYLHEYAKEKNVRFFCYDVVCQYWIFLLKVTQTEELRERFEGLITLTIDFLSRWHGKTHAWFCQVINLIYLLLPYFIKQLCFSYYTLDLTKKELALLVVKVKNKTMHTPVAL